MKVGGHTWARQTAIHMHSCFAAALGVPAMAAAAPRRHPAVPQGVRCLRTHPLCCSLQLGLAADFAALALDKTTTVAAASRHADSVVAFVGKHLNV